MSQLTFAAATGAVAVADADAVGHGVADVETAAGGTAVPVGVLDAVAVAGADGAVVGG